MFLSVMYNKKLATLIKVLIWIKFLFKKKKKYTNNNIEQKTNINASSILIGSVDRWQNIQSHDKGLNILEIGIITINE